MKHNQRALRGDLRDGVAHRGVVTPFRSSNCQDSDSECRVDAPARARRRAEALARIRTREEAILRAVGSVSPAPHEWSEIAPDPAPAHRLALVPALDKPECQAVLTPKISRPLAAIFPSLGLRSLAALLVCSMLVWIAAWVVVTFFL